MTRRWRKLGRLYAPAPTGRHPKLATHAANPLPVSLGGDRFRVFFSGRDRDNRSSVGAVDLDLRTGHILAEHPEPVFEHGPPGSYFESGVSIACCYAAGGVHYMLFMGWQTPPGAHWRGVIGRLVVGPDLSLRADGEQPLLGLDATDPISLSYPWVIQDGALGYRMWYGSTHCWDGGNGEMVHPLHGASSRDGTAWSRGGLAVPWIAGTAQAFSRPTVVAADGGGYDMWFSCRGGGDRYRIGRARSPDGAGWQIDLAGSGIDVSATGWDSEMIEYPYVFDHAGARYMLYNGNGYGRSGFGLAVLE